MIVFILIIEAKYITISYVVKKLYESNTLLIRWLWKQLIYSQKITIKQVSALEKILKI